MLWCKLDLRAIRLFMAPTSLQHSAPIDGGESMKDLGYEYLTLDDCWSAKTRDANGQLQPEAGKYPEGIKDTIDYVHSKGLKFGLYTCVGTKTCKGDRPGSFGHYEEDAKTLAAWGVVRVPCSIQLRLLAT